MINELCCGNDEDVLWGSLVNTGPKIRNSFLEEDTRTSVCSNPCDPPRRHIRHRLVQIDRHPLTDKGRNENLSQSSFLTTRKPSPPSQEAHMAKTDDDDEKEQLLRKLQRRNQELRRILAEELAPLE